MKTHGICTTLLTPMANLKRKKIHRHFFTLALVALTQAGLPSSAWADAYAQSSTKNSATANSQTMNNTVSSQHPATNSHDSNSSNASQKLQAFTATYALSSSKVPFDGTLTRQLAKHSDGHWVIHSQAKALFSEIKQYSQFDMHGCTVNPREFSYHRKVMGKKKAWSATFNWAKKTIDYAPHKADARQLKITTAFVADRLSEQLSLRCHVANGHKQFSIPSFYEGDIDLNPYEVQPETQTLHTPFGQLKDTIKIHKIHENPNRTTTLWLWPEKNYLLVQFEQNDEGEKLKIALTGFKTE